MKSPVRKARESFTHSAFLRSLLTLILVVFVSLYAAVPVYADEYFEGEGTDGSPYLISEPGQLARLATEVNAGNTSYNAAHYKLTAAGRSCRAPTG
jgi:hypothetical protein